MRVISRHHLGNAHARVNELLLTHGAAFAGPERDPHTVLRGALEPVGAGERAAALPGGDGDPEAF